MLTGYDINALDDDDEEEDNVNKDDQEEVIFKEIMNPKLILASKMSYLS